MTSDERRAALLEKVARAICDATHWEGCFDGITCERECDKFRGYARAAIAVVLEEAAKTVDQMPLSHPGNAAETALECAAAIRAMIPHD
jgi:hypothetical protein